MLKYENLDETLNSFVSRLGAIQEPENDNDFLEPWERWLLRRIVVAEADSAKSVNFKNFETTFDAFLCKFKAAEVGLKDGYCYLQGKLNGGRHLDDEMLTMSALVIDVDDGGSPDEVITRASELGLYVLMHATYSNTPEHPKYRIVVPLDCDVPADKKQWKRAYLACADLLEVRQFDTKCANVARLFFYPRVPAGISSFWWRETAGSPVNYADLLVRADALEAADNKITSNTPRNSKPNLTIPNLLRFTVTCGALFDVEKFYLDHAPPEDVRGEASGGGLHCKCPNEDGAVSGRPHTKQGKDVTAFRVVSPWNNTAGEGWTAHCLTAGCEETFGGDRLLFLDALCQQFGIKDADELLAWCSDPLEARKLYAAWRGELTAKDRAELRLKISERIKSISTQHTTIPDTVAERFSEGRVDLVADIAQAWTTKPDRLTMAKALAAALGDGRAVWGIRDEINAADPDAAAVDIDPANYDGPISSAWDVKTQLDVTIAQLQRKNEVDPQLFCGAAGIVRVVTTAKSLVLAPVKTHADWRNVLTRALTFNAGDHIEKELLACVQGEARFDLPKCLRVLGCPVFAKDGSLKTERGYHAELEAYHEPQIEFLPVPDVVTTEHVAEAKFWIDEAVRDFPFSDCFGGGETLPIYLPKRLEDKWPEPNKARGRSSRAHFYCMFLNGFMMHFIDDVAPLFHIDKHKPDTGASYLASIAMIPLMGKAPAQSMEQKGDGEFEKRLTTNLKAGAPISFMDNINSKVASAGMATMLTGRVIIQRLLGGNTNIEVENRFTWITAGNNVGFTTENVRRVLPIFLDAGEDDPKERAARGEFKHTLPNWIFDNRAKLVWSAHVLGRFALQHGLRDKAANYKGPRINSFEHWSRTMGTLLELIGVEGFLSNLDAFQADKSDDREDDKETLILLWRAFTATKDAPAEFTTKEAYSTAKPVVVFPKGGGGAVEDEAGGVVAFGFKLRRLKGVHEFEDGKQTHKVRLIKTREKNPAKWEIRPERA